MQPVAEGDRAWARGDEAGALIFYAAGEARLNRVGFAKVLLAGPLGDAGFNQLALLYRANAHERLLEKALTAPAAAAPRFWAGTALLQKAIAEKDPDAQLAGLERASQELALALRAHPDDWDTKFNYEMAARLLARLRQEPEKRPGPLLQLLRPQASDPRPKRRVG